MTVKHKRSLGVCYYPEHWPQKMWAKDAARMKKLGLTWVRIGEFAWSQVEPRPNQFEFDWLDEAIQTLGTAGLKVVLGTPTATPPRWMLDRHPDMLALDQQGRPRKFGSRRHYCFSHTDFRGEAARITRIFAERYGENPYICAWQTDNEYGCHDTVISYSQVAREAFIDWLAQRYQSINALNNSWGNDFWSMNYDDFTQIDLPNLTVTEANPAHQLAFRRFSSDQVLLFNRKQVDIIRKYSKAPITHNYMGRITQFDHHKIGDDLDFASWDSYPIGFLEDRVPNREDMHPRFTHQGDPDFQAFHHDLYRGVGKGRWWVMEQQPGPVNWAPYNSAPLPGMVKLWSWEAFAHGAETVSYFRWRQASVAQEQLHSGLRRPDDKASLVWSEIESLGKELLEAPNIAPCKSRVALIFDYESEWTWDIQPHGNGLSYFQLVFEYYVALRKLGLSIDIIRPDTIDLNQYQLIFVPGVMHMNDAIKSSLIECDATVVIGPRSGSRDKDFKIPELLPPSLEQLDTVVEALESLRPDDKIALQNNGNIVNYREFLSGNGDVFLSTKQGQTVAMRKGSLIYVGSWLDQSGLKYLFQNLCMEQEISTIELPDALRIRDTRTERFWINYDNIDHTVDGVTIKAISVLRQELPMTGT